MNTGEKLRAARRALGLSQEALGKKLGVTFQQVQKYETGHTNITIKKLIMLASILKTTPKALLPDDCEEKAEKSFSMKEARLIQAFRKVKPEARSVLTRLIYATSKP